jgi:RIP metalloprotease RseP
MEILGILAFVVALLFSVMVHEFGHYLTARKFGMRVSEFFLGFGKRIWSFTRGETEFGLKAIPAGGYCRIEGMTPQDQMAEGEEGRAFFAASSAKKLIVLGAGSFAHFALGFLLIFSIFFAVGYQAVLPDIAQVSPKSAAESAGFKPGDRILTIDQDEVDNWAQDSKKIAESEGREMIFTVKRGDQILTLKANPQYIEEDKRYILGVVAEVGLKRDGLVQSTQNASSAAWALARESVKSLFTLPTQVPELFQQTFMGEERDPNGLVGVVGAARVSGEVVGSENWASPLCPAAFGKYFWNEAIVPAEAPRQV